MDFEVADQFRIKEEELTQPNLDESVSDKAELKAEQQEIQFVETTLSYDKTTGKFRFGTKRICCQFQRLLGLKYGDIAENLMKWWKKRETLSTKVKL